MGNATMANNFSTTVALVACVSFGNIIPGHANARSPSDIEKWIIPTAMLFVYKDQCGDTLSPRGEQFVRQTMSDRDTKEVMEKAIRIVKKDFQLGCGDFNTYLRSTFLKEMMR